MIELSTQAQEGVYQASKWIKFPLLCEAEELGELFEALAPFSLFHLGGIGTGEAISIERFLGAYQGWIDALKKGDIPSEEEMRRFFATVFADDLAALWRQEIPGKGFLIKLRKPLLQMQSHFFTYSPIDGEIRSLSMGEKSIFWGIQLSYPQLYQDGRSGEIQGAEGGALLKKVRSWMREATLPAMFSSPTGEIRTSMRLGKKSKKWIGDYTALKKEGLVFHA